MAQKNKVGKRSMGSEKKTLKQKLQEKVSKIFKKKTKLGEGRKVKELRVDHHGWLQIGTRGVNVVKEFEKVPNLNYRVEKRDDGYSTTTVVYVTNDVNRLVELYLQYEGEYANMPLNEFIVRTLSEAFSEPTQSPDKLD